MDKLDHDASGTYMLNAKFLLILFVVIANSTEPFIHQNTILRTIYLCIYTFVLAASLTWLLSQKWLCQFSRPLIEPNLTFLEKILTRNV